MKPSLEVSVEPNIAINASELIEFLLSQGLPFALWREPHQPELQLVISKSKEPDYRKADLDELPGGFILAPFDYTEDQGAVFIKADLYFKFSSLDQPLRDDQLNELDSANLRFVAGKTKNNSKGNQDLKEYLRDTTEEQNTFESIVTKAKESIDQGLFEKVVLSRKKEIRLNEDFNVIPHFKKLCDAYPAVFCSLTYLPWEGSFWLGATPETLVQQNEQGIFKTMALAGTQPAFDKEGREISNAEALWSQKEIEEQALVCRYIINSFKKIRVREYVEIGPKTARAGNLLHLQTAFEVDTASINFPQMAAVMLKLLHPTSAVCGMPKIPASEFIKKHECYDRQFYSGFLGPVNINKNTRLYVNLRTMKVQGQIISLFAGCGITADSSSSKEWNETQMKLKTVLA